MSPEVEEVNLGTEGVLCQSQVSDGSLEMWEEEDFNW